MAWRRAVCRARASVDLRRVLRTPEHWDRIVALAAEIMATAAAVAGSGGAECVPGQVPRGRSGAVSRICPCRHQAARPRRVRAGAAGAAVAGHFGLAVRDYMHSTAPNRRFPDVIDAASDQIRSRPRPPPYTTDELRHLAAHCTMQEDNAAKVERLVGKSAAALLLAHDRSDLRCHRDRRRRQRHLGAHHSRRRWRAVSCAAFRG